MPSAPLPSALKPVSANGAELRPRGSAAAATLDPAQSAQNHLTHHHAHGHNHGQGNHHHHGAEEGALLLGALQGKGDAGSRIALAAVVINVALAVTKALAGVWLHSSALLADAAHSASDTVADVVALVCWQAAQAPVDEHWPRGRGRIEPFGGVLIAAVLLAGAAGIGGHSASRLLPYLPYWLTNLMRPIIQLFTLNHAHHHDHGEEEMSSPLAILFVLLGLVAKEYLYRATMAVAQREKSSVLAASALHHRSDSLAEALVLAALVGSWAGFPAIDPIGGVVVAGAIGAQGLALIGPALGQILDRGAPVSERAVLVEAANKALTLAVEQVPLPVSESKKSDVHHSDLVAVQGSGGASLSLVLVLAPRTSVAYACELADAMRSELKDAVPTLGKIEISFKPASTVSTPSS